MALVSCPECRQAVSTAAASCPHCGHPLLATGPSGAGALLGLQAAAGAAGSVAPAGPERELWRGGPSAKALLAAIAGTVILAIAVPVALFLLHGPASSALAGAFKTAADRETARTWLRLGMIALGVVLVGTRVARVAWRLLVLKSERYRITNQRILIESGVLSKRIEEIDMRTVEDLTFQQGLIERLLGIGAVTIVGSDRTAGSRRLQGVAHPREVRELIRGSAYQATRGQLFTRET